MAIFAIVLLDSHPQVRERILSRFPGGLEYSQTFFLVEADKLTQDVAIEAGIKGDSRLDGASGFVIKLESFTYSGFTSPSLWEWLKEAKKRQHG